MRAQTYAREVRIALRSMCDVRTYALRCTALRSQRAARNALRSQCAARNALHAMRAARGHRFRTRACARGFFFHGTLVPCLGQECALKESGS